MKGAARKSRHPPKNRAYTVFKSLNEKAVELQLFQLFRRKAGDFQDGFPGEIQGFHVTGNL